MDSNLLVLGWISDPVLGLWSNMSPYKLHKGTAQLQPFEPNKKVIFSVLSQVIFIRCYEKILTSLELSIDDDIWCGVIKHGSNVMKSVWDYRLLSANDVINLIFKMAPRLIKRVYSEPHWALHLKYPSLSLGLVGGVSCTARSGCVSMSWSSIVTSYSTSTTVCEFISNLNVSCSSISKRTHKSGTLHVNTLSNDPPLGSGRLNLCWWKVCKLPWIEIVVRLWWF